MVAGNCTMLGWADPCSLACPRSTTQRRCGSFRGSTLPSTGSRPTITVWLHVGARPCALCGVMAEPLLAGIAGTYHHYAEPRHSTTAITEEAVARIQSHGAAGGDDPLFLYVAYTAAHAPLEPLPHDLDNCRHFNHSWRQKFCGLVTGLDRGVGQLVAAAREHLGEDTVIVFTSDNGGAPWFGGLNEPLRSGKTTPFQGGVRVPTFVLDMSPDKRFFGGGGRQYEGLAHMSDWLPTLATMAGTPKEELDAMGLDGVDLGPAIATGGDSPRSEMLLEMYYHSR